MGDHFIFNKSDYSIHCTLNGNQIIMSGCDDIEKIKSIAGITSIWVEEASEISFEDWTQLCLRIRGQHKNYPEYFLSFNPTSEDSWLKLKMWDVPDDQVYKLETSYKDNHFLTKDDKYMLEERLKSNPMMYKIYALNQWGTLQTGGEMVHKFDIQRHTTKTNYKPDLPLHISVDFNVLPHCSMGIFQIQENQLIMIDEIALEHPNNRTVDMCKAFRNKYLNHVSGLFIYGDVAGKHADTRTEVGSNDYTLIMKELAKFRPQLRVGSKAPSIVMSTNFLNSILNNEIDNINLLFDKDCKHMINDLLYLKQNSEGGKLIEYEKHPVTGTKYEKYAHFFDLLRYCITTIYASDYQIYQTGSKPFANVQFGKKPMNTRLAY